MFFQKINLKRKSSNNGTKAIKKMALIFFLLIGFSHHSGEVWQAKVVWKKTKKATQVSSQQKLLKK